MSKNESDYTVWKIAGGIVLGLIVWNAMDRWQTNQAIAAYNEEVARVFDPAEIERRSAQMFPQIAEARRKSARDAQRAREAAALKPGERCISGQRLRRIPNGWEQIGSC